MLLCQEYQSCFRLTLFEPPDDISVRHNDTGRGWPMLIPHIQDNLFHGQELAASRYICCVQVRFGEIFLASNMILRSSIVFFLYCLREDFCSSPIDFEPSPNTCKGFLTSRRIVCQAVRKPIHSVSKKPTYLYQGCWSIHANNGRGRRKMKPGLLSCRLGARW